MTRKLALKMAKKLTVNYDLIAKPTVELALLASDLGISIEAADWLVFYAHEPRDLKDDSEKSEYWGASGKVQFFKFWNSLERRKNASSSQISATKES